MRSTNLNETVSLKELREKFPEYISAISEGRSFTVVKRSKPIFQINPIGDDGVWQTIADFTDINEVGIPAEDILDALS